MNAPYQCRDGALIVTPQARARFLKPQHYALHRILPAIALNTALSRLPPEASCTPTHWLMPLAVLERHFPHVLQTLTNTDPLSNGARPTGSSKT
jgi:hypothetical protein